MLADVTSSDKVQASKLRGLNPILYLDTNRFTATTKVAGKALTVGFKRIAV